MVEHLQGERWITSSQKRLFDTAVSSVLLPVAIPASVVGAAAFLAESHINPLFLQKRLGRQNRSLQILKLRTMPFRQDFCDSSNGHADERASRVGKLLRKSTIDEAPQVLHILAGQMSIVGPRPLVALDIEKTIDLLTPDEQREWRTARSIVKPGWLSEFGNLSRDLEPQSEEYLRARVEYDCRYIKDASFETDIHIIRNALAIGVSLTKIDKHS